MKNNNNNQCYLESFKKNITVGDILTLHCVWSVKPTPPLKWKWENKKQTLYDFVVLKTISLEDNKGVFEVTSYRSGMHELSNFTLTHKEGALLFPNLKWTVQSVLPKNTQKQIKPYPPYGPWQKALPAWGLYTMTCIGLGLIIIVIWRLVVFFKRRKWVKKVCARVSQQNPFRQFISNIMLLERTLPTLSTTDFTNKLKHTFSLFLEEVFFIPTVNCPISKTLKYMHQDHPLIYKQHKNDITSFFKELSSPKDIKPTDFEQLLNMGRELGIKLFSLQSSQNKT